MRQTLGLSLLAFGFGLLYALVLVRYYRALNRGDRKRATAWDGVLGLLAMAPFQAWAASGSSAWVLLGEVAGSMAGTWLAVR